MTPTELRARLEHHQPQHTHRITRTGMLAWRWMTTYLDRGHFIDETIHLTKRAAKRAGQRWLSEGTQRASEYERLIQELIEELTRR